MLLVFFMVMFVLVIGFYDGILGFGMGVFFMFGFVVMVGYGIFKVMVYIKLLNFVFNVGGMVVFVVVVKLLWVIGFVMGVV